MEPIDTVLELRVRLLELSRFGIHTGRALEGDWQGLGKLLQENLGVCTVGARAIVVKMALGAFGQRSPIRLPFACPHIVDLGYILPLEGLLLVTMVVSGRNHLLFLLCQIVFPRKEVHGCVLVKPSRFRWQTILRTYKGFNLGKVSVFDGTSVPLTLVIAYASWPKCPVIISLPCAHSLASYLDDQRGVFHLVPDAFDCLFEALQTQLAASEWRLSLMLAKHRPPPPHQSILSPAESSYPLIINASSPGYHDHGGLSSSTTLVLTFPTVIGDILELLMPDLPKYPLNPDLAVELSPTAVSKARVEQNTTYCEEDAQLGYCLSMGQKESMSDDILECLDLGLDTRCDGSKGGECAGRAMHLARCSPAEGGNSEIGGDGDGVVMGGGFL
ncbi:hypothetical protein Tco_0750203 [Tanacetum coccineum]|uniref:Uncharacterized protein n=1 Tax=Tanacetum coccineum TaxID=301880 RepID=A0ABQ4Z3C4_9ASTR